MSVSRRSSRFSVGIPTLFVLLQVTFIINETFLSNFHNVSAKVFFKLIEEDTKSLKDNNITVFRNLLHQISATKPPPSPKDKEEAQKKLGKLYNSQYQSISLNPTSVQWVKPTAVHDTGRLMKEDKTPKELFNIPGLSNRRRRAKKEKRNAQRNFQAYLHQLSHCPLKYQWKDLGHSAWPRYVKETYCVSKGCSYPSGMTCQPSQNDMVKVSVLYWTCNARVRKSKSGCGWSMVHMKQVGKCICTCDST